MCAGANRYRYNGKEFNEELGLYDYGARWYDPAIGRWGQIDPLASDYASMSPYNYVGNNPIKFVDPDGRYIDIYYTDDDGKEQHYRYGSNEKISNDFVKTVVGTLDKLVSKGLDVENVISTLAGDETDSRIYQTTWDDHNNSMVHKNGGNVNWSPEGGIVTDDGDNRSPAVGLLHELGHIYYEVYDPDNLPEAPDYNDYDSDADFNRDFNAYEQRMRESSGSYHTPSDKWIIERVENPASSRLGQPTRNSHSYKEKYQARKPFSTKKKKRKKQ